MAELKRLHPVWPSWAAAAGLVLLFMGERLFVGASTGRVVCGVIAGSALAAAVAARVLGLTRAAPEARPVQARLAIATGALALSALAYAGTLLIDANAEEGARWTATLWAISLVSWSVGAAPLLLLETTIAPVAFNEHYEQARVEHAWRRGLSFGLFIPVLFLANFLVERHDQRAELALGSQLQPSEQTRAAVRDLTKDVRVLLFYPRRNLVAERLERYFEPLLELSPHLTVERVDQALAREEAKKARVSGNGFVAVYRGELAEKIGVATEPRAARRALRRFDADFLKKLLKTTVAAKTAYFVSGHDERSHTAGGSEDPRPRTTFLAKQLENMQYDVQPLGLAQGLQSEVPDDAGLVFIMGPTRKLLPDEQESLRNYVLSGGRLFVALDANMDVRLETLLEGTGLTFHPESLADESNHVTLTRTKVDRTVIPTNGFIRHATTDLLARNRRTAVLLNGTGYLERADDPEAERPFESKITVESLPSAFVDQNGNYEQDPDEPSTARPVIAAVTTTSTTGEEGRMVVWSDVDAVADELIQQVQGNVLLLRDTVFWLQKEDDPVVTIDADEDVKIVHRREEDVAVFYGTTFGVPLLVLGLGWLAQRRRRTS